MMLYADDDWSFGSKSIEASIKTIEMDGDAKHQRNESNYFASPPIPILTKEGDFKKPVARSTTATNASRQSGSTNSSQQRNNNLLKKMSSCGGCLYCTPGVLAVFAGLVHGLSGPGEVLGVIPGKLCMYVTALFFEYPI